MKITDLAFAKAKSALFDELVRRHPEAGGIAGYAYIQGPGGDGTDEIMLDGDFTFERELRAFLAALGIEVVPEEGP